MNLLMLNIVLAVTWTFATGHFTLGNLALGFFLGYLVMLFARRVIGASKYFEKVPLVIRFAGFYLWQLILSNLRVAYDVITPTYHMRPGVIAVPLEARTDAEITLLANLITLTPGTLSLDLSEDQHVLYVHVMYIDSDDLQSAARQIKEGLERRVLEVMR